MRLRATMVPPRHHLTRVFEAVHPFDECVQLVFIHRRLTLCAAPTAAELFALS